MKEAIALIGLFVGVTLAFGFFSSKTEDTLKSGMHSFKVNRGSNSGETVYLKSKRPKPRKVWRDEQAR